MMGIESHYKVQAQLQTLVLLGIISKSLWEVPGAIKYETIIITN